MTLPIVFLAYLPVMSLAAEETAATREAKNTHRAAVQCMTTAASHPCLLLTKLALCSPLYRKPVIDGKKLFETAGQYLFLLTRMSSMGLERS